jgi:hypothetical protein
MQPFWEPHERERGERGGSWWGEEMRVLLRNTLNPLVSNSPPGGPLYRRMGGTLPPPRHLGPVARAGRE